MIKNHPFEYVYFNCIGRQNEVLNFERDYWGVSDLRGLEYVVKSNDRKTIKLVDEGPIIRCLRCCRKLTGEELNGWPNLRRQNTDFPISGQC